MLRRLILLFLQMTGEGSMFNVWMIDEDEYFLCYNHNPSIILRTEGPAAIIIMISGDNINLSPDSSLCLDLLRLLMALQPYK